MTVRRIVANLESRDPAALRAFYTELFGLDVAMDLGWVVTLAGEDPAPVQLNLLDSDPDPEAPGAAPGPVPHLSIEVDDVDAVHARAQDLGVPIEMGLTDEPWGVRRCFLRDPDGRLLNVLSHRS